MKVIIADDEVKICQLIYKLVDWDDLDMQVVSIIHDGIDALKAICDFKPDIVITDIRMPGYDGLELIKKGKEINPDIEFIIISGYRQFEYAQNAIRYGVKNYLLKPIQKIELIDSLSKIRANYLQKAASLSTNEKYLILKEKNRIQLRESFMKDVVFRSERLDSSITLANINNAYLFYFKNGLFQTVIVKIDGLDFSYHNEVDYIHDKIQQFATKKLLEKCYDLECIFSGNFCYIYLNYNIDNKKEIRPILKKLMDEILCQKDILNRLNITIGLGCSHKDFHDTFLSSKMARWAIEQRLLSGTNKILDGSAITFGNIIESKMFNEFNKRFENAVDRSDTKEILNAFSYLRQELSQNDNITGHEILQMSREAVNLYIFTMQKNRLPLEDKDSIFDTFDRNVENQISLDGVISLLTKTILKSYKESYDLKIQEANKPVREAKNYIKDHLKDPISLEQISSHAGFNASYFSSLFKKETGINFSEYLTQARMEKTKELLKNTELNIAVICEEVGYNDLKNFNKNFKKYTGLRPNEFRKIYS